MTAIAKRGRIRLDDQSYDELRRRVLARDGWRCQWCGSRSNLHIHHLTFRSQAGPDRESNLITLCAECHRTVHCGRR